MTIRNILFLLLGFVFSANKSPAQDSSITLYKLDTVNLVIRICKGNIPGQKSDPTKNHYPYVCSYTYTDGKLISYEVMSFDMVLQLENGEKHISTTKGNRFSLPIMQWMILKASENKMNKLFLDNIEIQISKGENKIISGQRNIEIY